MKTKRDLLRIIRRMQTFVSVLLFLIVFLFCWHVTDFHITEIQLSKWGESGDKTAYLWNSIVCLLSISILINSILYIKHNSRIKYKGVSYFLFSFVFLCLFNVGLFNVNYSFIHNLAAYLYFFSYPLAIFIFTYLNRSSLQYNDWIKDITISVLMIFIPLIFIYLFKGMALAEIAHISLVIIWNLKLAFNDNLLGHGNS